MPKGTDWDKLKREERVKQYDYESDRPDEIQQSMKIAHRGLPLTPEQERWYERQHLIEIRRKRKI
jgi:hypothetical protein